MVDIKEGMFGEQVIPRGAESCILCHNVAEGEWVQKVNPSKIQWANLNDRALWERLQTTPIIIDPATKETRDSTGELLIHHAEHDRLIDLGFQGMRGMDEGLTASFGLPKAEPPPLSKKEFLESLREWVDALDASKSWPKQDCSIVLAENFTEEGCSSNQCDPGKVYVESMGYCMYPDAAEQMQGEGSHGQ
jgi:hypothetical protein